MPKLCVGERYACPGDVKRIGNVDTRFDVMHPKFFPQLVEKYYKEHPKQDAWTNNILIANCWPEEDIWS